MAVTGDFSNGLPRCAVVDEDFGIGADTSEVVSGKRKPYILHKLCVRSDGLEGSVMKIWP